MIDVLSFGEALIDFLPGKTGCSLRQVETFRRCLGGAPANLALGLARLGGNAALMAKLGEDEFGHYLREELARAGVDVAGVVHTTEARTGLAFVELGPGGERRFLFYRHPSADMTIGPGDVDTAVVAKARVVHAGTNLLIRENNRQATWLCYRTARSAGALTSLDLNLRFHQWPTVDLIRPTLLDTLPLVDVVKANDEELEFLCPGQSAPEAFASFFSPLGVRALVVTMGPDGAAVATADTSLHAAAPRVDAVDTTGAGDGFLAGMLRALTRQDTAPDLEDADWARALRIGNEVGSRICTAYGATTAMPSEHELSWD
jgi:fructokinase